MFTLMCRDLGVGGCSYIAKGATENEVIQMMIEHGGENHPDKLTVISEGKSTEELEDLLRDKIRREM